MDVILAVLVVLAVLALDIVGTRMELAFIRKLRLKENTFISKLVVAFLAGFIVFVLFTDSIPLVQQRVTVIIVCLLLIYANLFLATKKGEIEGKDKER
jgi:hypothetical protein